jgi:hypothetical protein
MAVLVALLLNIMDSETIVPVVVDVGICVV